MAPNVGLWVGNIWTDWNNPANSNPYTVPPVMQHVIIPEVISPGQYPIVNVTGLSCKNLALHPNATMMVPAGKVFKTKGN